MEQDTSKFPGSPQDPLYFAGPYIDHSTDSLWRSQVMRADRYKSRFIPFVDAK
jgi:hypothetical protein